MHVREAAIRQNNREEWDFSYKKGDSPAPSAKAKQLAYVKTEQTKGDSPFGAFTQTKLHFAAGGVPFVCSAKQFVGNDNLMAILTSLGSIVPDPSMSHRLNASS